MVSIVGDVELGFERPDAVETPRSEWPVTGPVPGDIDTEADPAIGTTMSL
jgi:hypothetical protein